MILNETAKDLCRELRRLLDGETTYLESARHISRMRVGLDAEQDPDFIAFVAIDSETDHLPVGSQRQYWSEESLARKEPEMVAAEKWARSFGEVAAQNLLRRFCADS